MDRNVNIITDLKGNRIVLINDIIFKGKRSVNGDDVKSYLEAYVGEFYEIADTKDIVYIGKELPDEYTGSRYTYSLKGQMRKLRRMHLKEYQRCLKLPLENILEKTPGINTSETPQMDGIDMIHVLRSLFMMIMVRWNVTMCFMHPC